jgi:protein-tyrosine phosphatase
MKYNFAPAAPEEENVFGSERPAARTHDVTDEMVQEWLDFMQAQGIQRVVNLLDDKQMQYFESDLMEAYRRTFGAGRAIWVPVTNFTLIDYELLTSTIFPFLAQAEALGEKVVVHCAGGIGRTGHVLAAWMVHRHGLTPADALQAVCATDAYRNPAESVDVGMATMQDLHALLDQVAAGRKPD